MAARFRFSLQRVLDYRIQLEDQAKMVLAKAQRAHLAAAGVVSMLESKLEVHEASLYSQKEITENDIWLWRRYRTRLQDDIEASKQQLFLCAKNLNAARQDLVTKSKDRKLLEKLRSNQRQIFRTELNLKEQRESDEMATLRYGYEAV